MRVASFRGQEVSSKCTRHVSSFFNSSANGVLFPPPLVYPVIAAALCLPLPPPSPPRMYYGCLQEKHRQLNLVHIRHVIFRHRN